MVWVGYVSIINVNWDEAIHIDPRVGRNGRWERTGKGRGDVNIKKSLVKRDASRARGRKYRRRRKREATPEETMAILRGERLEP